MVLGQVLATERANKYSRCPVSSLDPQTSHFISLMLGIWGGNRKEVLV